MYVPDVLYGLGMSEASNDLLQYLDSLARTARAGVSVCPLSAS